MILHASSLQTSSGELRESGTDSGGVVKDTGNEDSKGPTSYDRNMNVVQYYRISLLYDGVLWVQTLGKTKLSV